MNMLMRQARKGAAAATTTTTTKKKMSAGVTRVNTSTYVQQTRSIHRRTIQQQQQQQKCRASGKAANAAMVTEASVAEKLSQETAVGLLNGAKAFIFDCDGVIWRGDKLIEGIPETIEALRAAGKKLIFVTNNSTKSREGYLKKFLSLGLNISAEEIYSSSYAAAAYLKSKNFPTDGSKKVYVIGEIGIMEELALANIPHFGGPEDADAKITLGKGVKMAHDADVSAVSIGFDREINYYKIQYATLYIRENEDCEFIATNRDAVTHSTGRPGVGRERKHGGRHRRQRGKGANHREKAENLVVDDIADHFQPPASS